MTLNLLGSVAFLIGEVPDATLPRNLAVSREICGVFLGSVLWTIQSYLMVIELANAEAYDDPLDTATPRGASVTRLVHDEPEP